jgi:arylsulfatase A-like enzyme
MDLVQTMRSATRMGRHGASYPHSFVVDSLCCVSRASLLTGQYPHQTGVRTNGANLPNPVGPVGGWQAFRSYGNTDRSVNTRLRRAGYRTAFIGKYLNGYEPVGGQPPASVPRGWSDFRPFFDTAYDQWDFWWGRSLDGGPMRLTHQGAPPTSAPAAAKDRAYAGRIAANQAVGFITNQQPKAAPYFLEVAVYAPHNRIRWSRSVYPREPSFPAMFRDRPGSGHPAGDCGRVSCRGLNVADLPGWHDPRADNLPRRLHGRPARPWQLGRYVMPRRVAIAGLRNRARMVQSVDRMTQRILGAVDANTYVILTSDNGFHLGQVGMIKGKGTPYDTDIHVPLYVIGPRVVPGPRTEVVSNIDLASTFEDLAGLRPAAFRSGVSLVPTFSRRSLSRRDYSFVEHTWAETQDRDPDVVDVELASIPSYLAVRSRTGMLMRIDLNNRPHRTNFAYEFYEFDQVDWERTNTYAAPHDPGLLRRLRNKLKAFTACSVHRRDEAVPRSCRRITFAAP